jgi:hypothetical protein
VAKTNSAFSKAPPKLLLDHYEVECRVAGVLKEPFGRRVSGDDLVAYGEPQQNS